MDMDKHDREELSSILEEAKDLNYTKSNLDKIEHFHKEVITVLKSLHKQKYQTEIKDLQYSLAKFIPDCRGCNENEENQAKAEYGWAKRELINSINSAFRGSE